MSEARQATLLSGDGRYADPWHPFDATSNRLAHILRDAGYEVAISREVDATLAGFEDPSTLLPDLLVVNAGMPRDGLPSPSTNASAGLTTYLLSGRPVLGMHTASTTFGQAPLWGGALGGSWVRGWTMHPPQGLAQITVVPHSITSQLADFALVDERYSFLRVASTVKVLATHSHAGTDHPLIWVREGDARLGRAAYDALGHDEASYDSIVHRQLLARILAWLDPSTGRVESRA